MTWWLRTTYSRAKYGLVYCRVSVGTIQTGQGAVYQDYHMYTQLKWNSIGHKRKFLGPHIQDQNIVYTRALLSGCMGGLETNPFANYPFLYQGFHRDN